MKQLYFEKNEKTGYKFHDFVIRYHLCNVSEGSIIPENLVHF